MIIKSKLKYIQSLSHKKFRDEEGVFIAEGPKLVAELMDSGNTRLKELYSTRDWAEKNRGHYDAGKLEILEEFILERISSLSTPNEVLGIFYKPEFEGAPVFKGQLNLVLEGIQDPGNLGTIIRIADWFGVTNIVCGPGTADAFNSKVVQSTMGSISRVRIIYIEEEASAFLEKQAAIPVFAAALGGKNLFEAESVTEAFIIIGNESKGISPALLSKASQVITIPRKGKAESLNAAVATGIILAHFSR